MVDVCGQEIPNATNLTEMLVIRYPLIRADVPAPQEWRDLAEAVHTSGRFSNFGPLCRQLEGALADAWGAADSVCVLASSGTAAIAAPLIASGIRGPVLVPAFTFPATLAAVRMAGATPLVMDVDARHWLVSPDALDRALSRTRARAAVVVSPFGMRSDFSPHAAVARRHGAMLVIDNAAGLGVNRAALETASDVVEAYSLHATKPFAVGEGGAIFAHRTLEEALRRALNFGLPDLASPPGWGINGKLSEVHAAIGLAAARRFAERLGRRRQLAARYIAELSHFPGCDFCSDPSSSAWQLFPVLHPSAESADLFMREYADLGAEARRYYTPSLSQLDGVDLLEPCPISEDLSRRMCCVPVYASYEESEAEELVRILATALTAAARRS